MQAKWNISSLKNIRLSDSKGGVNLKKKSNDIKLKKKKASKYFLTFYHPLSVLEQSNFKILYYRKK